MNLKLLALITIVFWLFLFALAIVYKVPVAYVPEGASMLEYDLYHVAFITVEAFVFTFLFVHMIKKSKLSFYGDLSNILH